MKDYRLYILFVLCTILCSCERYENPDDFKAKEVKLFAKMGVHLSVEEQTKVAINSTTQNELPIGILRMDDAKTSYPSSALSATIGLPDPEEGNLRIVSGFSSPQFFKNSTAKVWYTAWYPNDGQWQNSNKTVTFDIPTTGDKDIMYSNVVEGEMSTGFDIMQFNHALSLFKIYAYSSTKNLDWGDITSVKLIGLPSVCTITLPNDESEGHSIAYSGNSINMAHEGQRIDIPTGFEKKAFIKEWIGAPAVLQGSIKGLNISVTTANEDNSTIKTHELTVAGNFKPGYSYDIVLRFSDSGTVNAEVKIGEWQQDDDIFSDVEISQTFYNLSANGTANCYIVSSANFGYSFDATIKGNGSTAAMPGSTTDPYLPVDQLKKVKVIWCDNPNIWTQGNSNNLFKLETEKIVEGKVLFKVNGNAIRDNKALTQEGNILLGVYDQQDRCLWTWHIWITDKPQRQNYQNGYVVLDRNLGATASTPGGTGTMHGLFYQWGRPTPFHIDIDMASGQKIIHGTNSYTRVTPDVAVQNPLTFYGRFEDSTDGTETPETTGDVRQHDWVDRSNFQYINNLWGYREVEHEQPIKTLYDPCPQGYHVPYSRTWSKLNSSWTNRPSSGNYIPSDGVKLTIEGNEIWYPRQGFIDKDGVYNEGHIHIETNNDGTYKGYHKDTARIVEVWSSLINRHNVGDITDDSPYRFLFTKDYGAILSDQYSNRTRGLAVRCVSDNTADVVKDLSASQTANCYMIHEDGYYKFKTTVRGNGVGSLLPLGGTTTAEINGGLTTTISPAVVDILWWQGDFTQGATDFPTNPEEKIRETPPTNMCLHLLDNGEITQDGYVAFQITGFKKGNLVLAAYNDDSKTQILWTWHIWLTDKPNDIRSGNYTKMDRFLGATFAPDFYNTTEPDYKEIPIVWNSGEQQSTLGFYYQWGRKDPLIGPPGYYLQNNENANKTQERVNSSGWWKKEGTQWKYYETIPVENKASIPEVVKEPMAFYRSTSNEGATTSQWFPESFADAYTNVALWGYAVADYDREGQTFSKTMHDPCPPGYRTPFHFSWRYNSTYKYAEGDLGEAITALTINKEYGNDWYGIITDKSPYFEKMWFPYGGYRDPQTGGYTYVGTKGYMHTGMPMGKYNTRSFWYGPYQDGGNTKYGTGQYAGKHGSAYGKMIRCMKE